MADMNGPVLMTISGSPRDDGTSERMLRAFMDEMNMPSCGYNAFRSSFSPCVDCRVCRSAEGCVFDDMDGFFRDFEECAGIVIATPVYNMSFPAPLKAIIDRMQRYYSARFFLNKRPPIVKKRPVALLLSAGSENEDGCIIIRQLRQIFTVTNCELVCSFIRNRTDISAINQRDFELVRSEAAIFRSFLSDITHTSQYF